MGDPGRCPGPCCLVRLATATPRSAGARDTCEAPAAPATGSRTLSGDKGSREEDSREGDSREGDRVDTDEYRKEKFSEEDCSEDGHQEDGHQEVG